MKLFKIFTVFSDLKKEKLLSDALLEELTLSYQQNDHDKEEIKQLTSENARIIDMLQQYRQLSENLTDLVATLQQHPAQSQVLTDALVKWTEACTAYLSQSTPSNENLLDFKPFSAN